MILLRVIIIVIFMFFLTAQNGFCAAYRVKDIVVDNSDKVILIKGEGNFRNSDSSVYVPIPENSEKSLNIINNISTFTITSPNRYVIDIPNASLVNSSRVYKLSNSSAISSITLGQFSTSPDVVRVVFNTISASDLSKFKTYTNGSDIIVKYSPTIVENSIQYKFYTTSGDKDKNANLQNTSSTLTYNNSTEVFNLTPRFQTKYYLSRVNQNSDGLILRGIGQISLEKTIYNQDNTKAYLTLDNASLSSKLDNKSFSIPSSQKNIKAILTINKLNSRKIKLTLDGENLRDYRFVLSPDGQSLFISHRSYIINTVFSSETPAVESYKISKTQNGYKLFDVAFSKPVAYDVFELNDNFYLDINNLQDYNPQLLSAAIGESGLNVQALKISSDKTRFIIPANDLNFSYANVESNAKSIKICFKEKTTASAAVQNGVKAEENSIIIAPSDVKNEKIKNEKNKNEENINVTYVPKNEKPKTEKRKNRKENTTISSMKKVVLDPGHGGADSGAIGGGIYEKTINLSVAKLVEAKLKKKNVYVYMTRSKDETLTLEDRVLYSNEINPDIFISIHTNSTVQEDIFGLETHYFKDDSYDLANLIHTNFASEKNLKKWDTKDRGVIKSRFYVINHTEVPAVLIEIGFISNLAERSKIITKDRQEEIAESITEGILEYLKVK